MVSKVDPGRRISPHLRFYASTHSQVEPRVTSDETRSLSVIARPDSPEFIEGVGRGNLALNFKLWFRACSFKFSACFEIQIRELPEQLRCLFIVCLRRLDLIIEMTKEFIFALICYRRRPFITLFIPVNSFVS